MPKGILTDAEIVLTMSLTDTAHLRDLFDNTIFKNDKDQGGHDGPDLFENFKF